MFNIHIRNHQEWQARYPNMETAPGGSARLTELEAKWIEHGADHVGVIFRCPHCRNDWLMVYFEPTKISIQFDDAQRLAPDNRGNVVPAQQNFAWSRSGDTLDTLTITPSVDASKSGHWHGFVRDGGIQI